MRTQLECPFQILIVLLLGFVPLSSHFITMYHSTEVTEDTPFGMDPEKVAICRSIYRWEYQCKKMSGPSKVVGKNYEQVVK